MLKISTLWKKLSQQSVRILIRSTLPATIRMSKIAAHRQRLLNLTAFGVTFCHREHREHRDLHIHFLLSSEFSVNSVANTNSYTIKFLKTGELFAVIKHHCFELLSWYLSKGTLCCRVHTFGGFVFHFCDNCIPAFTFHMAGNIAASRVIQLYIVTGPTSILLSRLSLPDICSGDRYRLSFLRTYCLSLSSCSSRYGCLDACLRLL